MYLDWDQKKFFHLKKLKANAFDLKPRRKIDIKAIFTQNLKTQNQSFFSDTYFQRSLQPQVSHFSDTIYKLPEIDYLRQLFLE